MPRGMRSAHGAYPGFSPSPPSRCRRPRSTLGTVIPEGAVARCRGLGGARFPAQRAAATGTTQVAPISRGGGCAHAVSIASAMMPSPWLGLAWHVAGCGARRRHSYGRSGRSSSSVDDLEELRCVGIDGVHRPCSLQGARRCHSRRARDSGERCGGAEVAWAGESEGVWEEGVTRASWQVTAGHG